MVAPVQDVREWLALPEFTIPQSGDVVVSVVRAGILAGRLSTFHEAGVGDPVPLGDGVHGLLGTITIETERGPTLMRLPQEVGGWAAECCTGAQQGMRPFPARVRFRQLEHGVEVSFVEHEPKTIAPVDRLVVFVDESGNTGDAAITSGGSLASDQASFALVGIGEEDGNERLIQIMADLRAQHGVLATEIKARAMDRRTDLVLGLVETVRDAGLPVFIELMDKPYFVAMNIVTFVLGGSRLLGSRSGNTVANVLADLLMEHVDDAALVSYAKFARSPARETFDDFEKVFRRELAKARGNVSGELGLLLVQMEEVFEESVGACKGGAPLGRLLPPPDRGLRGKLIAMLPHVSAFTNLYARINRFSSEATMVRVVHDEQSHFGALLRGYALSLESNEYAKDLLELMPPNRAAWKFEPGKFTLDFGTSKTSAGIQAADVLARFCTRRMNTVISGGAVNDDPVLDLLLRNSAPSRGVGVNIVSTARRAELFWGRAMLGGRLGL